jgi:hypothetical protein
MAGVGQSDLPVISAGVQAAPLVTPADPNTLNSSAVSNLVDAFRQGFITQDDIVGRIGDIGQAKNKALLQQLGEYVSPDAIQARHNEISLSDPATEAKRWEIERTKWNTVSNGGVDAYQQYGPWFGHAEVPTKPDGTPDFKAMGQLGQTFKQPIYMAEIAQQGLTPDPARTQETQDASGKKGKKSFNKFGVDISPGSPGESYYRSLMGMFPGKTPPGTAPNPTANPAKAAPVFEGGAGAVSPSGAPAGYDADMGAITKSGPSVGETRGDILDKNQSFKIWEGNKSNIDSFHNIVNSIRENENSTDPESIQKRLEAERGLVYTLSELQQNQAQGAIPRSVITDWEHIVANPSLSDRVKSIIGKATGNKPLTDNQITSLIELGKNQIAGKASAALSGLKLAKKTNPGSLTDDEEELLNTGGLSEIHGSRAEALRKLQSGEKPTAGAGAAPAKTIGTAPIPKDKIIVTKQGRLKSLGDGTFLPLP